MKKGPKVLAPLSNEEKKMKVKVGLGDSRRHEKEAINKPQVSHFIIILWSSSHLLLVHLSLVLVQVREKVSWLGFCAW